MQESQKIQSIPVKVYRSANRLMVATPVPGMQPEDLSVEVTAQGTMTIQGDIRALLKDIKELLVDEWSVGSYYRELELPTPVDAPHANVTYGNGVLVVAFPLSNQFIPARLQTKRAIEEHIIHVGNAGHRRI